MTESEFQKFSQTVAACQQDLLIWKDGTDMPLPTMQQGVHLLLSQQKMARLYAILEAATVEATTQSLLRLFEATTRDKDLHNVSFSRGYSNRASLRESVRNVQQTTSILTNV